MSAPGERAVAWGDELVKLHDGFRRDLAALRRGGAGTFDLREHCLSFCRALHEHHAGEDDVLFPHLGKLHPELAPVMRRLAAEHRVVARLLAEIRAEIRGQGRAEIRGQGRAGIHGQGRAGIHGQSRAEVRFSGGGADSGTLDRLAAELEAHLDYEEEQLVPLLNAMTDLPEGL